MLNYELSPESAKRAVEALKSARESLIDHGHDGIDQGELAYSAVENLCDAVEALLDPFIGRACRFCKRTAAKDRIIVSLQSGGWECVDGKCLLPKERPPC